MLNEIFQIRNGPASCRLIGTQERKGIQPAGTTMRHVQEAHRASEVLGKAYNADTMPKTKDITPKAATVMKEIGQI